MAGTRTLTQFRQNVKRRLNEANNTTVGDLQDGSSTTATITTDTTIADFAQMAVDAFCRACFPIRGRFKTSSTVAANTRHLFVDDLVIDSTAVPAPSTGAKAWAIVPASVFWGSTLLGWKRQDSIEALDGAYLDPTNTATAPTYAYPLGRTAFVLYKIPTGTGTTLTVSCLYVPAVQNSGAMLVDIPDNVTDRILEPIVAALLDVKQIQDPELAARIGPLLDVANEGIAAYWRDLMAADPFTWRYFYGEVAPSALSVEGMLAMAGIGAG